MHILKYSNQISYFKTQKWDYWTSQPWAGLITLQQAIVTPLHLPMSPRWTKQCWQMYMHELFLGVLILGATGPYSVKNICEFKIPQ